MHVSSDHCGASDVLLTTACHSPQVSIAVGLVGFACFLLLVLFVLINKYGRRSKFGMKGKSALIVGQRQQSGSSPLPALFSLLSRMVPENLSVWLLDDSPHISCKRHLFKMEPYD